LYRPQPLVLSIVVLDNISIVADSAEKVAQEKRLAHLLEVRCGSLPYDHYFLSLFPL
jgi:hypothetical protein